MAEQQTFLQALPDEILTSILFYLDPGSLNAVQLSSTRFRSAASQEILWRYNCRVHFRHWHPKHNFAALLAKPVAQVPWKQLFAQRKRTEVKARRLVDQLVTTQKQRGAHIEWLAEQGYDVKDELLRQKSVGDEAADVLARRYWANAALTTIHRSMAIEEWARLRNGETSSLERALGAYDLFVVDSAEGVGDLDDISARLDELAARFRSQHPNYLDLPLRPRALRLVEFMRAAGFTGVPPERYGRIEQNFIGLALASDSHEALPLVTVAIYCSVAERVGIPAKPCGYPMHIYAIVEAPQAGESLDGPGGDISNIPPNRPDTMYLDPFRSEHEVPRARLEAQLVNWGASPASCPIFLCATSVTEMVERSARNMRRAVEVGNEAEPLQPPGAVHLRHSYLGLSAALYGAMWAWAYLERAGGAASIQQRFAAAAAAAAQTDIATHRRRILMTKVLQLLLDNCPWEAFLVERHMGPLFIDLPESDDFTRVIGEQYVADRMAMAPKQRFVRPSSPGHSNTAAAPSTDALEPTPYAASVQHRIGTPFRHARYRYYGVVIGWDPSCTAGEEWVTRMDVDRLPNGRNQAFYNVLCEDTTLRYVAQENIRPTAETPSRWLRDGMAGRWFLRWQDGRAGEGDEGAGGRFVSNLREEYPDD